MRKITNQSNPNGNAGRPYDKCVPCHKFLGFADYRGNDPDNPLCDCGASSRRQMVGLQKRVPRGVHFVCSLGTCNFYKECIGTDGKQFAVPETDVGAWIALLIV